MPDAVELIKAVKRAALEAVRASKPAEVCFGEVTGTAPLKIAVEQKMILGHAQLILTRNVTDYKVEMTVDHHTEIQEEVQGDGTGEETSGIKEHIHAYQGKKQFTVHNGLGVGDEVLLLRQQGGQKYIVVDRIV